MKRNITKKRTPKKRQVMHNAIAHHPLTDARAAICPSFFCYIPFHYYYYYYISLLLLLVLYFTLIIKLFLSQPTSFTFFFPLFPPPHPTGRGKGEAAAWCLVADWG